MRVRGYAGGCEFLPLSRRVLPSLTWTERSLFQRVSVIERFTVLMEEGDVRQGGQDFAVGKATRNPADCCEIRDGN